MIRPCQADTGSIQSNFTAPCPNGQGAFSIQRLNGEYWTQKAIPDALPEREDFAEQMEVRENRRELEQVMNAAIDAVTQETDELQPMTERSSQEKDHVQER